jgi:cytochrome P450
MRQLTERVEQITAEHLDAMERHGPPVDLVQAYAHPIPAMMICELLGVPYADRESFQRHAAAISGSDTTPDEQYAAYGALQEYLHGLVLAKRAEPTDDLLSDLTTSDLTDSELAGIGAFLLGAGLDTTANMIALGAFALLRHPDQLAALRTDLGIADQAVEELLRYLSIAHTGARAALEDIELDGHLIKAGETVTVSIQAANRDPEKFADPDTLDLHRRATGHLAFGHGIHQCLGQQLARVEMAVAFPALVTRFPTLRLAIPPEDVPLRANMDIYGVHRLPVTWDAA